MQLKNSNNIQKKKYRTLKQYIDIYYIQTKVKSADPTNTMQK